MIYLLYGDQNVMINNRLKKIVKERLPFQDALNYITFDLDNSDIKQAIDEACYLPLGYDHKVVVIKNCNFLRKTALKTRNKNNDSNQDLSLLIKYLKKDNNQCDLILIYQGSDINLSSDIYKIISEKGQVKQLLSIERKDWNTYIYRYFVESLKIQIDRDAIEELANRVKGDLNIFVNEANKLSLYTDHVRYEDVVKLVTRPLEDNAFSIFNYLLDKNINDALILLDDLFFDNVEPVTLISMLANQFRLLLEIIHLARNNNLNNAQIAEELKIKEVRVKILKKYLFTISINQIMDVLDNLYFLDYKIKSGQVDRFFAFKMFVINFNF